MDRGIEWSRFGQRLRHLKSDAVRVVGTNTLQRRATAGSFFSCGSGDHQSRSSRARRSALDLQRRCDGAGCRSPPVIDIGGGSTELILGRGYEPELMDSLLRAACRCRSASSPTANFKASRFESAAELAARQELAGRNAVSPARMGYGHRHFGHDQRDQRRCHATRRGGWIDTGSAHRHH
jgi:hypothetical protein